ncbi:speckle-type POZ protein [Folsomia candida]|nr:speckle-type POZ protein [Folsomia candida]
MDFIARHFSRDTLELNGTFVNCRSRPVCGFPASWDSRRKCSVQHKAVMLTMLENGEGADVMFRTNDGEEVFAHRAILSAHSPVFKTMFAAEMKEKDGVVELDDMAAPELQTFLKFMYTGEVSDADWQEYYAEIVMAADKYQIAHFKDFCATMLPDLCSWDNAVELLQLVKLHSLDGVKEKIQQFMNKDPKKMFELLNSMAEESTS